MQFKLYCKHQTFAEKSKHQLEMGLAEYFAKSSIKIHKDFNMVLLLNHLFIARFLFVNIKQLNIYWMFRHKK